MTAISKRSKEKIHKPKPHGNQVAEVCGAIAGIPRGFRDAGEALRDVKDRCAIAGASTGILSAEQALLVRTVGSDCSDMMCDITRIWKMVDAMIAAGVALPEKPPTEDLF